ncbi:hypothetical protein MNBD_NITROSPIRAE03-1265 [hydrothermal vent metagenome]|uniref:Uncharacterized protein n=1 Tax=hydrothermal vent metagenome TaxID=652676 RepID=A0A3B1DN17_9ZZZZ
MFKKFLIVAVLCFILFQGVAFAAGAKGEIVFRDALYGAVVGSILGGAIYLVDQDNFAAKLGMGVAVGTLGGLFFGVAETRSLVEIKNDNVMFALPLPMIQKKHSGILYSASFLSVDF